MRLEGDKKLIRQLNDLPDAARERVRKAIAKSVDEGERLARTLAPDVTGETRSRITKALSEDGMWGIVIAANRKASKEIRDRQYAIEHGRKSGNRGVTYGYRFMKSTRLYLAKRFKGRIQRAIRQAAKDVTNG